MKTKESKMKLSQWHEGNVNPVNKGWYECKGDDLVLSDDNCAWRKWNGKHWEWLASQSFREEKTESRIKKRDLVYAAIGSNDKWRGIVKDKK